MFSIMLTGAKAPASHLHVHSFIRFKNQLTRQMCKYLP